MLYEVITYRYRENKLQIHTGGPLIEPYWSLAPYQSIESTKKYLESLNTGFKIKMKETK